MGGMHTVQATNNNPGVFGWVAVWSAGGQDTPEFAAALTKLKNSGVKHYYVAAGTTGLRAPGLRGVVQTRADRWPSEFLARHAGRALLLDLAVFLGISVLAVPINAAGG